MSPNRFTVEEFAAMIDHTFLKAYGSPEDIERLCREAVEYGFASVCVHPSEIPHCLPLLAGSPVKTGAVVGFPLGQHTSEVKLFETTRALEAGAQEIDMVINIRALQRGDTAFVETEIRDIAQACRSAGALCKVIIETCYLTDHQKIQACRCAGNAEADFVKTSTGFGPAGATVEDVRLMRRTVGPAMGVKAAGGIRDLATALAMVEAGASRIGASAGVKILRELQELRAPHTSSS